MYSGKLLHSLVNAYRLHLLEGQAGYFGRLKDFYLRQDFPPEFTSKYPPRSPDDLVQSARESNNTLIVEKLIDSLLDEYSIDSNYILNENTKNYALNSHFFPESDLIILLSELKNCHYQFNSYKINSILKNETISQEQTKTNKNSVTDIVASGKDQILKEFPFEKNVFVMMKFPDESTPNDVNNKLKLIWDTIDSILNNNYGLKALRADQKDYTKGGWLWDNVRIYMESSKYGIAVLENLSSMEFNPNIAIEFGYMNGIGRTVLLLKENSFNNIRADLMGRIWKTFSSDSLSLSETIKYSIHEWAKDINLKKII